MIGFIKSGRKEMKSLSRGEMKLIIGGVKTASAAGCPVVCSRGGCDANACKCNAGDNCDNNTVPPPAAI